MVFQFAADYLRHRFTANTRHGTHSPFVYKLTDEVIYDFSAKKPYHEIEAQRKKLLNDERLIATRPSSGQLNLSNTVEKLNKLAKHRLMPARINQLIYRLVAYRMPSTIVEFGTNLGISTAYLATANPNATIFTTDHDGQTEAIAGEVFSALKLTNVAVLGNTDQQSPTQIFIDHHTLDWVSINRTEDEATLLALFDLCLTKATPSSVVMIEGIYRNRDMKSAWIKIKNHPKVTVTIDLFWIGLVYFKEDQAREHFKIRF